MSSKPDPVAKVGAFEAEDTEAGSQTLVPGVTPGTLGDRLAVLANAPLLPRRGSGSPITGCSTRTPADRSKCSDGRRCDGPSHPLPARAAAGQWKL